MKLLRFYILIFIGLSHYQSFAKDYGILYIGNSLTQGSPDWCYGEGWEWPQGIMINPDSAQLGMRIWTAAVLRGATDLSGHWNADVAAGEGECTGIGELNDPTGCKQRFSSEAKTWLDNLDQYDYVVLQSYKWTPPYSDDIDYTSRYCDLALQDGTKPVLFCCWQDPTNADGVIATFDSLYSKYKSRGAILAPVFQAHRLVWNDPSKDAVTFLYNAGDAYHHANWVGGYLNMCVFYEICTGRSAVGKYTEFQSRCSDLPNNVSLADGEYCAAKAHQAVVDYYGAGNIPHLGEGSVSISKLSRNNNTDRENSDLPGNFYNLMGKSIQPLSCHGKISNILFSIENISRRYKTLGTDKR